LFARLVAGLFLVLIAQGTFADELRENEAIDRRGKLRSGRLVGIWAKCISEEELSWACSWHDEGARQGAKHFLRPDYQGGKNREVNSHATIGNAA